MIDYLEHVRKIYGAYYACDLKRVRREIAKTMRGNQTHGVLLLQDNGSAHTSKIAITAATECGFEILTYPPYSPDMAHSDFYLFPKLNSHLCGTQHGSNEGTIEAVNEYLWDQVMAYYFVGIRALP